jgi:DNA (cytosine-5)-methyltransferase 1
MRKMLHENESPVYPDMSLYQEVLLLQGYFDGLWVVENVDPWYDPLIKPQKSDRHMFWSNFDIPNMDDIERASIVKSQDFDLKTHEKTFGFDLDGYSFPSDYNKQKILNNCVHPEVGKAILESAIGSRQSFK